MSRRHRTGVVLGSCLSLLLAACAATPPPPEDQFYRLNSGLAPRGGTSPALSGTLKVDPVKAYGVYRERAILYTLEAHPERLQQHRYHYWIDTPSRLIRDHLVDYLRTSGVAEVIAGSQLPGSGDLRLKLTLKQFERVIHAAGPDSAQVALEAVITDAGGTPLMIRSYRRKSAAAQASISASVTTLNRLLNEIFAELLEDLRQLRSR